MAERALFFYLLPARFASSCPGPADKTAAFRFEFAQFL